MAVTLFLVIMLIVIIALIRKKLNKMKIEPNYWKFSKNLSGERFELP